MASSGFPIKASPVIGNAGEVYVANDSGQIMAVEMATGTRLWGLELGSAVTGKLLLDHSGRLYANTSGGKHVVIQTKSTGPSGQWPMQQNQVQGWGKK